MVRRPHASLHEIGMDRHAEPSTAHRSLTARDDIELPRALSIRQSALAAVTAGIPPKTSLRGHRPLTGGPLIDTSRHGSRMMKAQVRDVVSGRVGALAVLCEQNPTF